MSSSERPSTAPVESPRSPEQRRDGLCWLATAANYSTTSYSSSTSLAETRVDDVDPDFPHNHLNQRPFDKAVLTPEITTSLAFLSSSNAPTIGGFHYPQLCTVLTGLSKIVYDDLDDDAKDRVRTRFQVPDDGSATAYIEFVDHHTKAPTHFPANKVKVLEKPDLLGVPNYTQRRAQGKLERIPHHFIETLVEVKADATHGRAQAASYAYRHQQARPDHPAFLCLTAKPQYYQIILSEPCGVAASNHFPWSDLGPLASFFHTLYVPPADHILFDATLTWIWKEVPKNPAATVCQFTVSWQIKCGGQTYTEGKIFCDVGNAWGRRTTVFCALDPTAQYAIVKEYYWHHKRRFEESDFLEAIHADGDVPGVVRMICCEDVEVDGQRIECGVEEETLKHKKRLALYDYGYDLLLAESVNALLRAFYDVLEVHRTLFKKGILHRDMSINNILIHPVWRNVPGRHVMQNPPPLIEDVLSGTLRPEKSRTAECCLIDFDNSAKLTREGEAPVDVSVLAQRTGTPKYIARSVCLGQVLTDPAAFWGTPMPELLGKAKDLYIKAYGEDRYNAYAEEVYPEIRAFAQKFPHLLSEIAGLPDKTCHGGRPPSPFREREKYEDIPFKHRPEHDVESVCWTMISVFLRVQPADRPQEDFCPASLRSLWALFNDHAIYADPNPMQETRGQILTRTLSGWLSDFEPFPELHDLARLLNDIACQVQSEYALWDPAPPHADHLHEAVQRLILQYLVDHEDKDVKLASDLAKQIRILRPVEKIHPPAPGDSVQADGNASKSTQLTFVTEKLPAAPMASTSQLLKRKSQSHSSGTLDPPKTKRRKGSNDDAAA